MPIKISGLKCDNCTWRDDSVKFSEYHNWIGKHCPNCGTNLLTLKEYYNCVIITNRVEKAERILHALRWLNPLFYLRLIMGDSRKEKTLTVEYPKRKNNEH
jgi:hypothetical protein